MDGTLFLTSWSEIFWACGKSALLRFTQGALRAWPWGAPSWPRGRSSIVQALGRGLRGGALSPLLGGAAKSEQTRRAGGRSREVGFLGERPTPAPNADSLPYGAPSLSLRGARNIAFHCASPVGRGLGDPRLQLSQVDEEATATGIGWRQRRRPAVAGNADCPEGM
jgi:hypothetical protein